MHDPVTISTVSDYHQHGYTVLLFCPRCNRYRHLDLEGLLERYGDRELNAVLNALVCTTEGCGRKGRPGVVVQPPNTDKSIHSEDLEPVPYAPERIAIEGEVS